MVTNTRRLVPLILLLALLATLLAPRASYAQAAPLCFNVPNISDCIEGRFRTYWEQHGGLPVFGYPVTRARGELNRDTGQVFLTQWFERNRFELHPENAAPYDVLLGRLGDERLRQLDITWQSLPRATGSQGTCLWFGQTGHNVCNEGVGIGFLSYWQTHGIPDPRLDAYGRSLALFGLPLSEARTETNTSGDTVLTQWFERARLEWHPANPAQFKVLLGLLGTEVRTRPPVNIDITLFGVSDPGLGDPGLSAITLGPDSNVWFVKKNMGRIGRLNRQGGVTEFAVEGYPVDITPGPDGALWFTQGRRIGRITTAGAITEFALPAEVDSPISITLGPDGALWFIGSGRIGRMTTGGAVRSFPLPTANGGLTDIVAGPDGALWFTERKANRVGRITADGAITEFPLPTPNSEPEAITPGSDGALWVTERAANKIARISTSGGITEYLVPTQASNFLDIVSGPDGALWFTEYFADQIGRITTTGTITEMPAAGIRPWRITASRGGVWFTSDSGLIGAGSIIGAPTTTRSCAAPLLGGFGRLWQATPELQERLGCPLTIEHSAPAVEQTFERGTMYFASGPQQIYVLAGGATGRWSQYLDTYTEGEQLPPFNPPQGFYAPIRGFGKVWLFNPSVQQALGLGTQPEVGMSGVFQRFEFGTMLYSRDVNGHGRQIYVLFEDGEYQTYPD